MFVDVGDRFTVEKFPGAVRKGVVAFVIGKKAYVGLGYSEEGNEKTYYNDFWVCDGESHRWQSESLSFQFPGCTRENAIAFCLEGKAYVGTGEHAEKALGDFYTFEPGKGWSVFASLMNHTFYGVVALMTDGCTYLCSGGNIASPW